MVFSALLDSASVAPGSSPISTLNISLNSNPNANDFVIVAFFVRMTGSSNTVSVKSSDGVTDTYTTDILEKNGELNIGIARCSVAGGVNSKTVTITPSGGTVGRIGGYILRFSGEAASPLDQSNFNASLTPGSVMPGQPNELVIAICGDQGSGATGVNPPSSLGSFTDLGKIANSTGTSFLSGDCLYQVQTTATAENPTFLETTTNAPMALSVTYKPASAAFSRSPAENLAVVDTQSRNTAVGKTLAENLAQVDTVVSAKTRARVTSENLVAVDTVIRGLALTRTRPENLATLDTKSRTLAFSRGLSENLVLTEARPQLGLGPTEGLLLRDQVSLPVAVAAPEPPSWQDAVDATGHSAFFRVLVYSPLGVFLADITEWVESGTVTADETAQVRRTCSLSLNLSASELEDLSGLVPSGPGDLLHPVSLNELVLTRGLKFKNGTQLEAQLGVFRMTKPALSDTGDSLTLTLSGLDRSSVISRISWQAPFSVAASTNLATAVMSILNAQWPSALPPLVFNFAPTSLTVPAQVFGANPGAGSNDPFADAMSLATAAGYELFFDTGSGGLPNSPVVLRPVPDPTNSPVLWSYVEGENASFGQVDRTLDETSTYNGVIAIGNGVSGSPVQVAVWDTDPDSPTYYLGDWGQVPYFLVTSAIPSTGQTTAQAEAQLTQMATAQLQLLLGAFDDTDFVCVPNPAMHEGDVLQLTRTRMAIDGLYVASKLVIPLDVTTTMTVTNRPGRSVS